MKRIIVISLALLLVVSCRSVQRSTQKSLDLRSDWIQTRLDTDMTELRTLELGTMEFREIKEVETFDTLGRITSRTRNILENIEKSEKIDEQIITKETETRDEGKIEIDQEERSEVSRKFSFGSILIWLSVLLLAVGLTTVVFRFVRKGSLF